LVAVLDTCGYGQVADVAALLATELVTDAVLHGRAAPGREVGVRYVLARGTVRVEVPDACRAAPVVRNAGGVADGGRGLVLVQARAHGIGKTVWFELANR
jgi:serine/threonine-protein kinase RsbW